MFTFLIIILNNEIFFQIIINLNEIQGSLINYENMTSIRGLSIIRIIFYWKVRTPQRWERVKNCPRGLWMFPNMALQLKIIYLLLYLQFFFNAYNYLLSNSKWLFCFITDNCLDIRNNLFWSEKWSGWCYEH